MFDVFDVRCSMLDVCVMIRECTIMFREVLCGVGQSSLLRRVLGRSDMVCVGFLLAMGDCKWFESRQLRLGVARYDLGTYGYDWGGGVQCEEVQCSWKRSIAVISHTHVAWPRLAITQFNKPHLALTLLAGPSKYFSGPNPNLTIYMVRCPVSHVRAHGYLLKRDSPPQCGACQTQLTVEHVLLYCPTWNAIRANHSTDTNLLDLFSNVTSRCISDFIKEIGFYRRI